MAEAQESFVENCDCRTFMRRGGAGQPLLYLHGARGLPGWLPFLAKLADRFDVIAPDHPGYGRSANPPWLEDIPDIAYFYLELLQRLDLANVHVVGHSMGGWIAAEMAIRSTQRMKTLTLISAAGLRLKGKGSPDMFAMDRDKVIATFFHDPAMVARQMSAVATPEEETLLASNLVTAARIAWQPRFHNPKLRKWLRRIDVPTHIVWGDSDKVVVPDYAPEFAAAIAGSKVTILADAGHMLHMEKPDALADAVTGFIRR
jgi:pimeloyl-ACP methyl ester carboxylesterase